MADVKPIKGVYGGSPANSVGLGEFTATDTVGIVDGGTGAATAADARTNLGLVIGTDVQAAATTATVQTTDATSTALATIAIPTDEEKIIRVKVHGHEDATDDHIWKTLVFGVKNIAGTASQVGGVDAATGYDAGASTWTIVAGVSSGNATITVTGEAAHTIDWRATIEVD